MEQIVSKVEKQELEIIYIKKSLDEIVEQNKKQNEQLEKISDSIQKQEIILERIANLEDKYSEGTKRLHKRLDTEIERYDKRILIIEEDLKEIKSRPCTNHNSTVNIEIKNLKEKIAAHSKYFWFVNSAVIGAVIMALVGLILKK